MASINSENEDSSKTYNSLSSNGAPSSNTLKSLEEKLRGISHIQIDSDSEYYVTSKQISKRGKRYFVDVSSPSKISGSNNIEGLFSRKSDKAKRSSTIKSRSYLSGSSSSDPYKQGVEITDIKHWLAGTVKISAGTPGHIIEPVCFGITEVSIQDNLNEISHIEPTILYGAYNEIDLFNPINFIFLQDSPNKPINQLITFPIVTSDNNQLENYVLNGVIEPFPIRSVISNFSINFPFEPHSTKGAYGNGNLSIFSAGEEVLTVDYYNPQTENMEFFLDEGEPIIMENGKTSVSLGTTMGYFNNNQNSMLPFDDNAVLPRGEKIPNTYTSDLAEVVNRMLRQTEVYVTNNQRASTSGIVYDNATKIGTDSIAFGGMIY